MTPLFIESFELYRQASSAGFTDYLRHCGYTVNGTLTPVPDRSLYAVAADLSNGDFSFSVESLNTVIAFGFAMRYSTAGVAWELNDDLVFEIGGRPQLNGLDSTDEVPANRWVYVEIVVDKPNNAVRFYLNEKVQATAVMPQSLRYLTRFQPTFAKLDGLRIDDVYVAEEGRMGPIATTAHFSQADMPWSSDEPGAEVSSGVSADDEESGIKFVAVKADVGRNDLDNRTVAAFVDDQEQEIPAPIGARYSQAVFPTQRGDVAWTEGALAELQFGVRITN